MGGHESNWGSKTRRSVPFGPGLKPPMTSTPAGLFRIWAVKTQCRR